MALSIFSLICAAVFFLALGAFASFVIFKLRKIESQTDSTLKHCCRMSIYMNIIHQMEQNTKTLSSEYRIDTSIEKRAELYLEYELDFLGRNLSENMVRRAYVAGAKEKKAADIEKAKNAFNAACGWLSTYPWYNEVFEKFVNIIEKDYSTE